MLGNFHGTSATSVPGGEPCSSRCDRRSGIESLSMIGSKLQPPGISRGLLLSFSIALVGNHSLSYIFGHLVLTTFGKYSPIQSSGKRHAFDCSHMNLEYLCDIKGRLPLLEELDIDMIRRGQDHWRMEAANIFEDAPLLTHVVLWDAPGPSKFNWSSLTVVSFQQFTKNFLPILRETINLVELCIEHSFPEDLYSKEGRLIHLPRLERLSINAVAFLTILATPSLQQLKLNISESTISDIDRAGIMGAFLRRWGIKLSALVIEDGYAATAKAILLLTPEPDKLALLNVSNVAIVFDWMAETGTQELRFNSLLVKWTYRRVGEGLAALHDMITLRNPSPKEVFIQILKESQSGAANVMQPLCRDRGI